MLTFGQWVRDRYGLLLDDDRCRALITHPVTEAASHAVGILDGLDAFAGDDLAADLAANAHTSVPAAVWCLAVARDMLWQTITAYLAHAQRAGCTRLPSGPGHDWRPACLRDPDVARRAYPALANSLRPEIPPRFTAATIEQLRTDLSRQPNPRFAVTVTDRVVTVSDRCGGAGSPRTCHEPDVDGLYALGGGRLAWQQIGVRGQ